MTGTLPVVRAPALRFLGIDASKGVTPDMLRAKVLLRNPNPFPIALNRAGFRFHLDGEPLADLGEVDAGTIGPGAEQELLLPCRPELAETVGRLVSARGWDDVVVVPTGVIGTPHGELVLAD